MTSFPLPPPMPLLGGCPCGAIRYRITALPLAVYACHCTNCQRESGSSFALNMPVPTESFTIDQGQVKAWRRLSPSGARVTSWFCPDCGGRLHGSRETRPERVNVRAGTLDDTTWLHPAAHLYVRSAQPWETMSKEAACYETLPDDFGEVIARWRAAAT